MQHRPIKEFQFSIIADATNSSQLMEDFSFFFKHQHNFFLFKRGSFFFCIFLPLYSSIFVVLTTSHYPLLVLYLQEQVRPHVPVKMCPTWPMLVSLCWVTEENLPLTLLPLKEKHKLDKTSKRTCLPILKCSHTVSSTCCPSAVCVGNLFVNLSLLRRKWD